MMQLNGVELDSITDASEGICALLDEDEVASTSPIMKKALSESQ
jgi:hypothetical protein